MKIELVLTLIVFFSFNAKSNTCENYFEYFAQESSTNEKASKLSKLRYLLTINLSPKSLIKFKSLGTQENHFHKKSSGIIFIGLRKVDLSEKDRVRIINLKSTLTTKYENFKNTELYNLLSAFRNIEECEKRNRSLLRTEIKMMNEIIDTAKRGKKDFDLFQEFNIYKQLVEKLEFSERLRWNIVHINKYSDMALLDPRWEAVRSN